MNTRRIFCFLSFLISHNFLAADICVNPALPIGQGNYHQISTAVAAANNGDRILIAAGSYTETNLILNKSLELLPSAEGLLIQFTGFIELRGFGQMDLKIIGFDMPSSSIQCALGQSGNVTNGAINNRASISIIDSKVGSVIIDHNWYKLTCLYSKIINTLEYRFGDVVCCRVNELYVRDEEGSNVENQVNRIIADSITTLSWKNDNSNILICNNVLHAISIVQWNQIPNSWNRIENNDFSFPRVYFPKGNVFYNFKFNNNLFSNAPVFPYNIFNGECGGCFSGDYGSEAVDHCSTCPCCYSNLYYSSSTTWFPQMGCTGTFEWTYNGFDFPLNLSDPGLNLIVVIGEVNPINGGSPSHEYYDIDLTVNDRGKFGGPYSWNNYYPESAGRARIYDLQLPVEFIPGSNIEIKASAIHRN